MNSYSKLYSDIVTSSIWSEDDKTRIVWITILALRDINGYVPAALPGIANASRVTIEECEKAIEKLESPDKYSRTPDNDGRRIKKVEGGWIVLNHQKFRERGTSDIQKEQIRERVRRFREKHNSNITQCNASVTVCNAQCNAKTQCNDINTNTNTNKEEEKIVVTVRKPPQPTSIIKLVDDLWIEELKADCAKQGIDLDNQLIAMKRWLSLRPGRKLTQRFVINWLNKCDKTIQAYPTSSWKPPSQGNENTIANMDKEFERSKQIREEALK